MKTYNIPLYWRKSKRYPYYTSWPGAIINPHLLEQPLSRTNFHGPKGVRAIEVLLYHTVTVFNMGWIDKTIRGKQLCHFYFCTLLIGNEPYKRSAMVEWLERLGYGAESHCKVVSTRLGHAKTGKLSLSTSSEWVPFFWIRKGWGSKRRWMGSTFYQLCPRYSETLTPTAPIETNYGKPLPYHWDFAIKSKFFLLMADPFL